MSELQTVDREVLMDQLEAVKVEVGQVVEQSALPAKLDHVAGLVDLYDQAVREYNDLGAEIEKLAGTIQAVMGDSQTGLVKGVSTFTYNWKNSWRTTDLKRDHGHLTRKYMVEQVVAKFDAKAFARDHPAIARQYQTREFRRVSGTRNAVGR